MTINVGVHVQCGLWTRILVSILNVDLEIRINLDPECDDRCWCDCSMWIVDSNIGVYIECGFGNPN